MSQAMMSRRENITFLITSFIFIGASAAVGFMLAISPLLRGVMIVLLLVVAALQLRSPSRTSPTWWIHLYLGVQGALIATLMFLIPGWSMFPALFCLFSVQAILLLSLNPGIFWIVAYVAVTAVAFAVSLSWDQGVMALIIYGGLNAFFGAYANALLRADAARRESQSLLDELRQAHGQLQEYALRAEEMAVVEERNRLAREMHDTLGHRLTVASVQLEAAQRVCPSDAERAAGMVGTVRQQVREALAELRATVAALRAPVEADLRLRSALRRLTAHFEQATGLTVHRALPDEMPPLPDAHRMALFRAAQEALTNIQRHAEASQVWLVLTTRDEAITLLVGDDGKGVSRRSGRTGFGLQGMRERAEQLGGELHVEPRRGGGTQLSFRLPLPQEEDDG